MDKYDKKIIKNTVIIIMGLSILLALTIVAIVILVNDAQYPEAMLVGVGLIAEIAIMIANYIILCCSLDILEKDSIEEYLTNNK